MADPFKYTVTFENVSVGNGANEAAAGVAKVAGEVAKLQGREADLRSEFSALSERFDVTKTATYSLGERIRIVGQRTADLGEENRKLTPSLKLSGNGLLQLAQAADDAQYGLRGVLNNIPGLVLSLGGTAGLAGALSIGAIVLSQFISHLGGAAESASVAEDRIKSLADAAGQMQADKFEAAGDAIEAAAERADALRQNWTETQKAEDAYSTAAISNAEKLAQAQALIAEALGIQIDHFRELEGIAARQAEARRVEAENAIQAERQRVAVAQEAETKAADFLTAQRQRNLDVATELIQERAKLEVLQKQRDELQRIADQRFGLEALLPDGEAGNFNLPGQVTPQAEAAKAKLNAPGFQTNLQATQARVSELENNLEALTKDGGIVQRAENAFLKARSTVEDVNGAVEENVRRLTETFAADDLVARSQNLVDQGQALATGLSQTLGKVTANTSQAQETKATIEQIVSDGKVTANESAKLGEALRSLIGQIQAGLASYSGPVSDLIALQTRGNALVDSLSGSVSQLKSQISVLEQKVSTLQSRK